MTTTFLDLVRKAAQEQKERFIAKGGKGSGWHAPPKGTHGSGAKAGGKMTLLGHIATKPGRREIPEKRVASSIKALGRASDELKEHGKRTAAKASYYLSNPSLVFGGPKYKHLKKEVQELGIVRSDEPFVGKVDTKLYVIAAYHKWNPEGIKRYKEYMENR